MPVWQARQLSFDTAKLIADKGGVVGLWPMRSDVGATPEAYAQRLWELGEWLGDDHAAFGTDMNAISRPAIASYADLQKVVRYWQKAGFPAASIQKLAIGNYARVLKAAMTARAGLAIVGATRITVILGLDPEDSSLSARALTAWMAACRHDAVDARNAGVEPVGPRRTQARG